MSRCFPDAGVDLVDARRFGLCAGHPYVILNVPTGELSEWRTVDERGERLELSTP